MEINLTQDDVALIRRVLGGVVIHEAVSGEEDKIFGERTVQKIVDIIEKLERHIKEDV